MDENSCEGETSKSAENDEIAKETCSTSKLQDAGVRIPDEGTKTKQQVLNENGRVPEDLDSQPSTSIPLFLVNERPAELDSNSSKTDIKFTILQKNKKPKEYNLAIETITLEYQDPTSLVLKPTTSQSTDGKINNLPFVSVREPSGSIVSCPPLAAPLEIPTSSIASCPPIAVAVQERQTGPPPVYEERREVQPRVRLAPGVEEELTSRRPSVGPPPSYSFVMKQKRKSKSMQPNAEPAVIDRVPPPTYSNTRGLFAPPEDNRMERMCTFPSFAEPIWRSHSQPALCPRCGIIILTSTHSHDSVATHVAALALCLFGCWPCCLLPYCMSVCKNTYHHCPICQSFLGLYTPW